MLLKLVAQLVASVLLALALLLVLSVAAVVA